MSGGKPRMRGLIQAFLARDPERSWNVHEIAAGIKERAVAVRNLLGAMERDGEVVRRAHLFRFNPERVPVVESEPVARARPTTLRGRITGEEVRAGALAVLSDVRRPSTREECRGTARPCPFVSCKHHLYLDVNPETGSIKLNFPDLEPWEMKETCALDVADRGGITLEEVGEILNLTRERIRQVEVRGLLKLKMDGEIDGSKDLAVLDRRAAVRRSGDRGEDE